MNEKLPPTSATSNADYRYELPYAASVSSCTAAKASEAGAALYRYGTTTSAADRAALPTEFGGTLRSSKGGGSGGGSHNQSPQRKHSSAAGSASRGRYARYCNCFGGAGSGGKGGGKGALGGRKQPATVVTVWPALLANLGICALLLGYIFIGSFVFLTIENSGDNERSGVGGGGAAAERDGDTAVPVTRRHFAQMPQLARKQQEQHQQQRQQQQQEHEPFLQSHSVPQQTSSSSIASLKLAHRDNSSTNGGEDMRRSTSANFPRSAAEAYNDKLNEQHENDDNEDDDDDEDDDETEENTNGHVYPYAYSSSSSASAAYSQHANVDYGELQSLNMGVSSQSETQLAVDMERQRTVDNIWDITFSLNILYKDNWTKLAALEISKLQDQLVKRLVMDLTLSALPNANNANGAQSTDTHSVARGRSGNVDVDGNGNTMSSSKTLSQNAKHLTAQQQQQQQQQLNYYQQQRFGRLQHARQQHQQQHRHQQPQQQQQQQFEWNFATAFLYSLTVITTVGYGTITPRTTLGRMMTIAYATLGIPLTLIYLSSVGGILAKLVRILCTRTLRYCCCCRGGGGGGRRGQSYCGFSSRQVSDRKCDLKLKQLHLQQQQQQQHLPYCYVRPPATVADVGGNTDAASFDTLSVATTSAESRHSESHTSTLDWTLLAPISLCVLLLLVYVGFGACVMAFLEQWSLLDGVYFCCMSLTTIGFSDMLPGLVAVGGSRRSSTAVVWFCAAYILSGLTLTSMCVNLLHEEILLRMRVVVKFRKVATARDASKERGFYGAPP